MVCTISIERTTLACNRSKMTRIIIGLISFASIANALLVDHTVTIPAIQFPLRNIQSSINMETNATFQSSLLSEFQQHYKTDDYVLNLPKLDLKWAPNPYPGFIESQKVVAINLRENGIYKITPGSFNLVPNMQYLDLSKNKLAFCDFFNYGDCSPDLITLVIEENQLPGDNLYREINKGGCFPKLQNLYIRKNHIRRLNFSLRQSFPSLVSLYLSYNEIDTSSFILDVPLSLAHLHVEYNRISSISSDIMTNLRTLNADNNIIRSICYRRCGDTSQKLLGTTKLEVLSLAENKITQIEACAFRDSFSLTSLNLSSNSIETIHSTTFTSLRVLSQLYLDNNLLMSVPNLNGNWYLKTLSLRNNKLTTIRRDSFSSFYTLQRLFLGGNQIRNVDCNTFADLTWLQELDLSGNELTNLPAGWMRGLINLKHLDLRNNRFMYHYQLSLSCPVSLATVNLKNNMITQKDKELIRAYCPYIELLLDYSANCKSNLVTCYA